SSCLQVDVDACTQSGPARYWRTLPWPQLRGAGRLRRVNPCSRLRRERPHTETMQPRRNELTWFDSRHFDTVGPFTLVPPTNIPPLAPLGPSLVLTEGMFFAGIPFVLQKSAAVSREILYTIFC